MSYGMTDADLLAAPASTTGRRNFPSALRSMPSRSKLANVGQPGLSPIESLDEKTVTTPYHDNNVTPLAPDSMGPGMADSMLLISPERKAALINGDRKSTIDLTPAQAFKAAVEGRTPRPMPSKVPDQRRNTVFSFGRKHLKFQGFSLQGSPKPGQRLVTPENSFERQPHLRPPTNASSGSSSPAPSSASSDSLWGTPVDQDAIDMGLVDDPNGPKASPPEIPTSAESSMYQSSTSSRSTEYLPARSSPPAGKDAGNDASSMMNEVMNAMRAEGEGRDADPLGNLREDVVTNLDLLVQTSVQTQCAKCNDGVGLYVWSWTNELLCTTCLENASNDVPMTMKQDLVDRAQEVAQNQPQGLVNPQEKEVNVDMLSKIASNLPVTFFEALQQSVDQIIDEEPVEQVVEEKVSPVPSRLVQPRHRSLATPRHLNLACERAEEEVRAQESFLDMNEQTVSSSGSFTSRLTGVLRRKGSVKSKMGSSNYQTSIPESPVAPSAMGGSLRGSKSSANLADDGRPMAPIPPPMPSWLKTRRNTVSQASAPSAYRKDKAQGSKDEPKNRHRRTQSNLSLGSDSSRRSDEAVANRGAASPVRRAFLLDGGAPGPSVPAFMPSSQIVANALAEEARVRNQFKQASSIYVGQLSLQTTSGQPVKPQPRDDLGLPTTMTAGESGLRAIPEDVYVCPSCDHHKASVDQSVSSGKQRPRKEVVASDSLQHFDNDHAGEVVALVPLDQYSDSMSHAGQRTSDPTTEQSFSSTASTDPSSFSSASSFSPESATFNTEGDPRSKDNDPRADDDLDEDDDIDAFSLSSFPFVGGQSPEDSKAASFVSNGTPSSRGVMSDDEPWNFGEAMDPSLVDLEAPPLIRPLTIRKKSQQSQISQDERLDELPTTSPSLSRPISSIKTSIRSSSPAPSSIQDSPTLGSGAFLRLPPTERPPLRPQGNSAAFLSFGSSMSSSSSRPASAFSSSSSIQRGSPTLDSNQPLGPPLRPSSDSNTFLSFTSSASASSSAAASPAVSTTELDKDRASSVAS